MNPMLHIVRKDVQGLSTFWALWMALLAAQVGVASKLTGSGLPASAYCEICIGLAILAAGAAALGKYPRAPVWAKVIFGLLKIGLLAALTGFIVSALVPSTISTERYLIVRLYFYALGAAWMLFAYILAASAILQDTPVGTRMFWATRPISGGTLLRAKLVSILLFLVIAPAIVWIPWRICCGFTPSDVLLESLKTMLWAGASVAPAIVLAALSGDGARFMLYNVVGLAGGATLAMIFAAHLSTVGRGVFLTRFWMGGSILSILAAIAVVLQFRSRRRTHSIALLLGGILLGSIAGACSRVDASLWFDSHSTPMVSDSRVEIVSASVVMPPTTVTNGGRTLRIDIRLKGIPAEDICVPVFTEVRVLWPDGTNAKLPKVDLQTNDDGRFAVANALGIPPWRPDLETRAKELADENERRAKNGRPSLAAWPAETRDSGYGGLLWVDRETAEKFLQGRARLTIHFVGKLMRPTVVFELPIVLAERRSGGGLEAEVLETHLQANKRPYPPILGAWMGIERALAANLDYYAVERSVPGGVYNISHGLVDYADGSIFFECVERLHLAFVIPSLWRTDHWIDAPNWTGGLSFAAARFNRVGNVDSTAQVPFGDEAPK